MNQQELKKLSRLDLIEMLLIQTKKTEGLQEEVASLKEQLISREKTLSKAFSIAQAALEIGKPSRTETSGFSGAEPGKPSRTETSKPSEANGFSGAEIGKSSGVEASGFSRTETSKSFGEDEKNIDAEAVENAGSGETMANGSVGVESAEIGDVVGVDSAGVEDIAEDVVLDAVADANSDENIKADGKVLVENQSGQEEEEKQEKEADEAETSKENNKEWENKEKERILGKIRSRDEIIPKIYNTAKPIEKDNAIAKETSDKKPNEKAGVFASNEFKVIKTNSTAALAQGEPQKDLKQMFASVKKEARGIAEAMAARDIYKSGESDGEKSFAQTPTDDTEAKTYSMTMAY